MQNWNRNPREGDTTGAWLALAGNHPKVVQTVMRHSSITLTMDTHGHLFPGQDAEAVASLPDILGGDIDAPEVQRATGTDGRAAEVMRGQSGRKTLQDTAGRCEPGGNSPDKSGCHKVLPINALRGKRRNIPGRGASRPGGI